MHLELPGGRLGHSCLTIWRNGRIEHFTSGELVDALNAAASLIGWERLGLKPGNLGTHLMQLGAAMAMYLGEVPVYTIVMIGRWSSDAFLRYIRKQVKQFSHNVSKKMIKFQFHCHVLETIPQISRDDPRQRNHPNNAKKTRNVGGDSSRPLVCLRFHCSIN